MSKMNRLTLECINAIEEVSEIVEIKQSGDSNLLNNSLEQLNAKIQNYEKLLKFGQSISTENDFKSVQKYSMKIIKELLHCEYAALYRVDDKSKDLKSSGIEQNRTGLREIHLGINEHSFPGACAYYKAILHIKDVQTDLRKKKEEELYPNLFFKEILLAPLVSQGELIGVIEAINPIDRSFNDEDIKFLEAVCVKLTMALENVSLFEKLRGQFFQVCEALADAMTKRDRYTGGHTKRVGIFSEMIAEELDFSFSEMSDLRLSALLHDIGKIGIADSVLKKNGHLTPQEFEMMKSHPQVGYEILGHIEGLKNVVDGVRYHHERFDGKGYPDGLKGDEIPVVAQIISVADTFDAMISTRPYRKGLSPMIAYEEILDNAGTQFSHKVVEAFEKAFKKTHMYKPKNLVEKKAA